MIVVVFTHVGNTKVLGTAATDAGATKTAIRHLKRMGLSLDDLGGLSWEEAVRIWVQITDGNEYFSFVSR